MIAADDLLIDELLENIDRIDEFDDNDDDSGSNTTPVNHRLLQTSSYDQPLPHTIYVQKRRYHKQPRLGEPQSKRYQPLLIPRILKNDIRRKYALMYTNVVNSHDYDLMISFFSKFFTPSCGLSKAHSSTDMKSILTGIELITYYNLLLAQASPDKITYVSNIQLKQRRVDWEDEGETELICQFHAKYTQVYDFNPPAIVGYLMQERFHHKDGEEEDETRQQMITLAPNSEKRKRKFRESEKDQLLPALDRSLFDPIKGSFCQTRLARLTTPIHHDVQWQTTFKINPMKQITDIVFHFNPVIPPAAHRP